MTCVWQRVCWCIATRSSTSLATTPSMRSVSDRGGVVLRPDRIYLGASVEHVGSDQFVPIVRAKSSIARLGLFVHVTADLIDIGSHGPTTFQLHAVHPLRVYAHMRIAQVTYWVPRGRIRLYDGKYSPTHAPMASRAYRDFTTTNIEEHTDVESDH